MKCGFREQNSSLLKELENSFSSPSW